MVGYVNWHRNRKKLLQDGVLDAIVADIKAHSVDHLAITGDLVNLALDVEIELARQWLETLGQPHDVSVVPGNHDAYVPGAFAKVSKAWAPWMTPDGSHAPAHRETFPYTRIRGNVALIGVTGLGVGALGVRPAAHASAVVAGLAMLTPPRKHYQTYYTTREANENMWKAPQGVHAFLRAYYHAKSADWT